MSREPGGAADLAFVSGAVYMVDGARRTAPVSYTHLTLPTTPYV